MLLAGEGLQADMTHGQVRVSVMCCPPHDFRTRAALHNVYLSFIITSFFGLLNNLPKNLRSTKKQPDPARGAGALMVGDSSFWLVFKTRGDYFFPLFFYKYSFRGYIYPKLSVCRSRATGGKTKFAILHTEA